MVLNGKTYDLEAALDEVEALNAMSRDPLEKIVVQEGLDEDDEDSNNQGGS